MNNLLSIRLWGIDASLDGICGNGRGLENNALSFKQAEITVRSKPISLIFRVKPWEAQNHLNGWL